MKQFRIHNIALYGVLTALAFILSWLETLLPNPLEGIVPGIKLGLANLAVLVALYRFGAASAVIISLLRVLLTAFTFGNLSMFFYSIAGAAFSLLIMILVKSTKRFHCVGVSILGGIAHNFGQITVAMLILGTSLVYSLPYLLLGGCISGFLIGLLGALLVRRLPLLATIK